MLNEDRSSPATRLAVVLTLVALCPAPASAQRASEDLLFHADFRLRLEQDWDSRRSDGTTRDDRARARVRVRAGIDFALTDRLTLGTRLRSGSDLSQQSPHVTILDFDGGETGDADFNLDQWFLRARSKGGRVSGWAGRDGFPFWKQNELFWDDDVTLTGLAGSLTQTWGERGKFTVNGGYFSLPVGMRAFSGEMGAVQVVYSTSLSAVGLTFAGGYYAVHANPADADADPLQNSLTDPLNGLDDDLLLDGDGLRDYRILVGGVQARLEAGGRPLVFGGDLISNGEDYTATDPLPFTAANAGQTQGHVLSARYGSIRSRGDWLAAYCYANIEALAVVASYAQDDWVRWGSGPQTRGSGFRGHEFRFAYAWGSGLDVVARLYVAESNTTVEDGKRFRVDLNYKLGKRR